MKRLFRFSAGRAGAARDVNDELRFHIDMRAQEFIAQGMSADDARTAAERAFGDYATIEDKMRTERIDQMAGEERREFFGDLFRDVRYALRALRRSPGFTVAAIAALALGIGAYTAIFSVVHAVLLAPLPFRESSQLAFIWSDMTSAGYPRAPLSAPELVDLRTRSTRFQDFGSIWATSATLTDGDEPLPIRTGLVTANFFHVLGADAARGRAFSADDESAGAQSSIVISWPLWQQHFGGDTSIVGRQIQMGGRQVTVIGIMPRDFRLLMPPDAAVPDELDAWTLLPSSALPRQPRGQQYLRVVGRMKPGVTLAEARADITSVATTISKEFAEYGTEGRQFVTVGLQADGVRAARPMLIGLFGGVTILLLIACVNVAGLLVARAASRGREIAVKLSLGAHRRRIMRECLVEGLVLTALGAAAGVALGYAGLRALLALRPAELERIGTAHLDTTVLAFSVATATICGILFSLAPGSEVFRTDLAGVLQRDGRQSGRSVHHRVRSGLVIAQVALSLVLLVGASLMYRTFMAIQRVQPGFVADSVLSFKVNAQGRSLQEVNAFGRALRERLAALPGVSAAGSVSHLPYDNVPNWGGGAALPSETPLTSFEIADYRSVSPGFMEAVRAQLKDGRFFTDADDEHAARVVLVDEQLARRFWPGESAVGREIMVDPGSSGTPTARATIVGVVAHMRQRSLVETLNDQVFFPVQQAPRSPYCFVLRTSGRPPDASSIRHAVAEVSPRAAVAALRPFESYVDGARAAQRFTAVLAGTFAVAALLLSSLGLFGVVAYTASRRTYEFGIRLALGAHPRAVQLLVAREALMLAITGTIAGVAGAVGGAHLLASQLYGVGAFDPVSYAIPMATVIVATMTAAWLPALRAGRVNPLTAIQND